jgi:hypothetical protein
MNSLEDQAGAEAIERLSQFRRGFYQSLQSLTRRADALFELAEAVLCADGPVKTLVDLSLAPSIGAGTEPSMTLYDGLNRGRLEVARFRAALAGLPLPRAVDGRIVLAVDVSAWLRPGCGLTPPRRRIDCSATCTGGPRAPRSSSPAGRPPSYFFVLFVAALEVGRTLWTALLDAVRLGPAMTRPR